MWRKHLHLVVLLTAIAFFPWTATAEEEREALNPTDESGKGMLELAIERTAASALSATTLDNRGRTVWRQQLRYYHFHVEFRSEALAKKFELSQIQIIAQNGPFIEAITQVQNLKAVDDALMHPDSGVRAVTVDGELIPPPVPQVLVDEAVARGEPVPIVRGGYNDGKGLLQGKGVIIAIVDTGVDFRHPDFFTRDRRGRKVSRLKYLWDLTEPTESTPELRAKGVQPGPVLYPTGAPVGTLYTQRALSAALNKSLGKRLPDTDAASHGTMCAGIAAGNGNAWRRWYNSSARRLRRDRDEWPGRDARMGVAPQADIIGVKIVDSETGVFSHGGFLPAICDWLDEVAGDRPLVVSCSFGGHGTAHDGSEVDERHLGAIFSDSRAGRALVIAAGNEGDDGIHTDFTFGAQRVEIPWTAPAGRSVNRLNIAVHLDKAVRPQDLRISVGGDVLLSEAALRGPYTSTISGRSSFVVNVPGKSGTLFVASRNGESLKADAYLLPLWTPQNGNDVCSWVNPTHGHLVGSPGNAASAITVGSFDWNSDLACPGGMFPFPDMDMLGGLSGYTSPGPRRDGLMKPEIVAPGQWYQSPLPLAQQRAVRGCRKDVSGAYGPMNGTSAATPYTSGLIALMFERDPTLTVARVKELLVTKAGTFQKRRDGEAKKHHWGAGRLDMGAVERIFKAINGN